MLNPDLAVKLQTTINWKSALLKKKTEKVDQINFGGGGGGQRFSKHVSISFINFVIYNIFLNVITHLSK